MISSIGLIVKKQLISNIILIPLIFPQIIFSILSLNNIYYLYLLLALSILMTPIFIIFSTIIVQNAISEDC